MKNLISTDWFRTPVFWMVYASAWLTFAAGHAAVYLLSDRGTLTVVISAAIQVVLPAAILGLGIIWLCRRIRPPDKEHLWAIPVHIGLMLSYCTAWILIVCGIINVINYVTYGEWVTRTPPEHVLHWHFVAGTMIYLTLASTTYALDSIGRAEARRRQIELQQLRAQLNPHFLFNTLHTLHALVRRDPDLAESAIEQFSDLLRYLLHAHKEEEDEVTFDLEWQFTSQYLELERLRFEERLQVVTDIDTRAMGCRVPTCVLQPLVENAIRHGIAPRVSGGTIWIEVQCIDDTLKIKVSDDGPGASSDVFSQASGVGLQAVRERLNAYYGIRARMDIETALEQGFSVTIRLPAQQEVLLESAL